LREVEFGRITGFDFPLIMTQALLPSATTDVAYGDAQLCSSGISSSNSRFEWISKIYSSVSAV